MVRLTPEANNINSNNRKVSFWDRPYREYDHLGLWLGLTVTVIVVSFIMAFIMPVLGG